MRLAARAVVAGAIMIAAAGRQAWAQDARLAARLDHETLVAVSAIVDSARRAKLPTSPLVDKALEGAAKGSDDARIVIAVRQLSARLGIARRVLGDNTRSDELKAAAAALSAGATPLELEQLHAAAGKRSITMPLAVLTDLVARNVPPPSAAAVVLDLTRAKIRDGELTLFQRNVRSDIDHGADPTVAATTRARGAVRHAVAASQPR
jgi:hypothetical protein